MAATAETGRVEAMETVVRELRLGPDARKRLRGAVSGAFAAVHDPDGQCFVLKRGAIGLYAIAVRFTPGQPVTLPPDAPADLLAQLPGCNPPR